MDIMGGLCVGSASRWMKLRGLERAVTTLSTGASEASIVTSLATHQTSPHSTPSHFLVLFLSSLLLSIYHCAITLLTSSASLLCMLCLLSLLSTTFCFLLLLCLHSLIMACSPSCSHSLLLFLSLLVLILATYFFARIMPTASYSSMCTYYLPFYYLQRERQGLDMT